MIYLNENALLKRLEEKPENITKYQIIAQKAGQLRQAID